MRQAFLRDTLGRAGAVVQHGTVNAAVEAVRGGLGVDVAVLHYRVATIPLIRELRHQQPQAKIVAYGVPRREMPLGVDTYLPQPLLSAELQRAVEISIPKRRRRAPAAAL